MKILTAPPFETLFQSPKFAKKHNNKKIQANRTMSVPDNMTNEQFKAAMLNGKCKMGYNLNL